jgi:hypothetical protein
LESGDASQCDERCGNCVLRKFKTRFVFQELLKHLIFSSKNEARAFNSSRQQYLSIAAGFD